MIAQEMEMKTRERVGRNIALAREALGWNQAEFGERRIPHTRGGEPLEGQRKLLLDKYLILGLTEKEFRDKRAELDTALTALPQVREPEPLMNRATIEEYFSILPTIVSGKMDAELANALARAFFRCAKYDYATRTCNVKFTWE